MERYEAIMWLVNDFGSASWPASMDKLVTGRMFGNWRFVLTLDNEIVFANCIEPSISLVELVLMECVTFDERVVH